MKVKSGKMFYGLGAAAAAWCCPAVAFAAEEAQEYVPAN